MWTKIDEIWYLPVQFDVSAHQFWGRASDCRNRIIQFWKRNKENAIKIRWESFSCDSIDRQMCITCTCTWWVLSVFVVSIQCDSDSFRFFRVIHTLRAFPSPIQWTVCTSECSWHRHANWTPNSSGTFIVRSSRPFRDFSDSLAVVGDHVIEYW